MGKVGIIPAGGPIYNPSPRRSRGGRSPRPLLTDRSHFAVIVPLPLPEVRGNCNGSNLIPREPKHANVINHIYARQVADLASGSTHPA
jgi:hypothetical protein